MYTNPDQILSYGPPILTLRAADCALDLIKLKVAAVSGVDLIDVTGETRQTWRNYLATYYLMLADRYSFANACWEFAHVTQKWPQMPPVEREMWGHTWAASLPSLLQFIEPVFPAAQHLLAALQNAAPSALQKPGPTIGNGLDIHNTIMTNRTIDLMRSWSRH